MEANTGAGLLQYFKVFLRGHLPGEVFHAFERKAEEALNAPAKMKFNLLFSGIPRLVGKREIPVSVQELSELEAIRKGFSPLGWTADRFCRVYLLMHLAPADPEGRQSYLDRIEELFSVAEVSEQVALYSALPLYLFPEAFRFRATEGIRTNITDVFDAIALHNPYPFEQLDEPAWNQMVLKALFMQRPIYRIYGVDDRANASLARILSDYAHERWSAGRSVSPELWRCVGRFIDDKLFGDIERLLEGNDPFKTEAAALACSDSGHPAAREILKTYPEPARKVQNGELTWDSLGKAIWNIR
ncbi:MAG TPA: EboA domain-containing protein [Anseongella sp.]|nr:EboA domain-containing protein [Anseongella sp.]